MQRTEERAILLFLVVVSLGALAMFLYYVLRLLWSLPDPVPDPPVLLPLLL